jgi:hypothetical protein
VAGTCNQGPSAPACPRPDSDREFVCWNCTHPLSCRTFCCVSLQLDDWLASNLPEGARVGLDPFCHTVESLNKLKAKLEVIIWPVYHGFGTFLGGCRMPAAVQQHVAAAGRLPQWLTLLTRRAPGIWQGGIGLIIHSNRHSRQPSACKPDCH